MWKTVKNMNKRKVIIDCAAGSDDAVMLALTAAHQRELDILAVITTGGDQEPDTVTEKILELTEFFGMDVPVIKGCAVPVLRDAVYQTENKGTESSILPKSKKQAKQENGILWLYRMLQKLPEEEKVTFVTTGALTDPALLFRVFPDIKKRIREVVFMGGSLSGGNRTAAAESNFYRDPEAVSMLFHERIPLVMCGLDVTEKCTLSRNQILKLCQSGSPAARLCGDILGFSLENTMEKYRGEVSIHAAVPVMYLLHPELFEGGHKILTVDCSDGASRGAVFGGFRWWKNEEQETNVYVLTDVDKEKFQEELIISLYELPHGKK